MKVSAIIPAAGLGLRMGSDTPKQFLLLDDRPVLHHTLTVFDQCSQVDEIVLVVSEKEVDQTAEQYRKSFPKVVRVVAGGKERQDSVYNGFHTLGPDTDMVIVHDGVRPFVTGALLRDSIRAAGEFGGAIAAIPVSDTLKKVDAQGLVERTLDRNGLWRVQTPQTFRYALLKEAFAKVKADGYYGTDEGALIEHLGKAVKIIQGSELNIKITQAEDLILGEKIAALIKINGSGSQALS
ncbi:MAG: 2-C-methyl-D-erythritol 4-phosphate cytidylyltransferase [Nitrospinaceae bacterium]|nr:2-C-methyl-D-erythritol 4-phosphate cytidylyltransferase [Nitrospinaceae bacterium]NIR53512.1 2-C-methyl-D-erythritol 4-phosphate cytidylyltransferase [Nitrospinaceae bacterium]NIS83911.1 2-C-methyl-D-erythritol 4-phosphate cytidylyltransferase [Nitrospinaceae bacterium]NIT80719.1 2-C-methyl-D-erythritol 4-phosphate cytidylyltransferase [Nitrospinaceae bacterium]NIU43028.1 2-C-methyl-D-erythritol 4-phosphate cytidylyltransferase [Nitrospinaceae bacterium]